MQFQALFSRQTTTIVLMRLDGVLAELMVTIAPNIYQKYITTNANGEPILYVQLEKALQGVVNSALLFYCKLVVDLCSIGFILNPYNPCIANKMVNGQQMTIWWLVDNFLISHKDYQAISNINPMAPTSIQNS
jgi:hypothetical protein